MVDEQHMREHLLLVCSSIFHDSVAMDELSRITTG